MPTLKHYLLGLLSISLLGCTAIQGNKEPVTLDGINFSGKNGTCSQQCLDKYTNCVKSSNSVFTANCKSSVALCVGSCPDAK